MVMRSNRRRLTPTPLNRRLMPTLLKMPRTAGTAAGMAIYSALVST
jgi:hypothetical protein